MPLLPLASLVLALFDVPSASACTNILVTPGASTDGSSLITYSADSHELYGFLHHRPAADAPPGAQRVIVEWDTGTVLGTLDEAPHTLSVIGNMNEKQVAIGETTFGGRPELEDPLGGIDYGSLIYIALERASTAREAVEIMTSLAAKHGFKGAGESLSISDPREVWFLEIVGKGPGGKGALWVARKLPDGTISAHANQARIRTFPLNDRKNVLYSPDVISFAREKGWHQGPDEAFSFADTYAPLDFSGVRYCEARVWSAFRRAAPSLALSPDMARGDKPDRLPLWIQPDRKLSVYDTMELMRDHFEGTDFDLSVGIGAGPYACPYRWRPLEWKVDGVEYVNERAISTQQTGFSFVAQSRARLPDPIGGVIWFGVDDTYSTVYIPFWAGHLAVPSGLAEGVADLERFSWDSTFWVFNHVANLAYTRYSDMIVEIRAEQRALEGGFLAEQPEIEAAALNLYKQSPRLAREYLTRVSNERADAVHARWRALGERLMVKYMDGNVKDEHGKVLHPPYPEPWRRAIAAADGKKLLKGVHPEEKTSPDLLPVLGFFHSAAELGPRAAAIPSDFPWATHKLLLAEGKGMCGVPARCCAEPHEEGGQLVLSLPEPPEDPCGDPGWWVKVRREEARQISLKSKD